MEFGFRKYRNGDIYNIGYAYNYYMPQTANFIKPLLKISDNAMLSTQAYASIATGGGRRVYGPNSTWLSLKLSQRNTL